jgi:hypothetical protein
MAAAAAGAAAAAAAAGRGQDVAQKLSIVPAAMVAAVVMAVMEAFTGCGRGQLQQLPTDAAAAGGCGGEAWLQALLGMVGWAAFRCATLCGCADGVLFACIYICALTYCAMVATMRLLSLPWQKGGRVHDGRQHINMRDMRDDHTTGPAQGSTRQSCCLGSQFCRMIVLDRLQNHNCMPLENRINTHVS